MQEGSLGTVRFVVVVLILASISLLCRGLLFPSTPKTPIIDGSRPDSVSMLDVTGKDVERDFSNSQTNLNNAGANNLNAQGDAALVVALAEATKRAAEACAIANNCFSQQAQPIQISGTGMLVIVVSILVLALGLLGVLRSVFK